MSDLIDIQAAIEALERDMASLDHIIKGMSANDVRLDAYVSQRNQVNYDIYTINNLPPVQPEQLGTNLAEVGTDCISRQAAIKILHEALDAVDQIADVPFGVYQNYRNKMNELPPTQPEIIYCKDCKKHNKDYHMSPYKDTVCPLTAWRGAARGHEYDYQFCCFAKRR